MYVLLRKWCDTAVNEAARQALKQQPHLVEGGQVAVMVGHSTHSLASVVIWQASSELKRRIGSVLSAVLT